MSFYLRDYHFYLNCNAYEHVSIVWKKDTTKQKRKGSLLYLGHDFMLSSRYFIYLVSIIFSTENSAMLQCNWTTKQSWKAVQGAGRKCRIAQRLRQRYCLWTYLKEKCNGVQYFNIMKNQFHVNDIKFSFFFSENTLCLYYKDQLVTAD
jgi:hypothetical protein